MEATLIGCAAGLCAFLFFLVIGGGISRRRLAATEARARISGAREMLLTVQRVHREHAEDGTRICTACSDTVDALLLTSIRVQRNDFEPSRDESWMHFPQFIGRMR